MTDKEKIREEIEKIKTVHSSVGLKESNPDVLVVQVCTNLLSFIDSLQGEPVSKLWHDASEEPKEGFTIVVYMNDDSLKVLTSWGENGDFCIGDGFWYNIHQQRSWAYKDDLLDKKEEPVSEDLEETAERYAAHYDKNWNGVSDGYIAENEKDAFKAGAQWQKNRIIENTTDAQCFGFQGAALFSFRLPSDNYLVGSKIKVIIVKED